MPKKQASEIDAHVGHRIRLRRMLLGMSQDKLGNLLGLTFQQVQKYERGVNRIGAGRLFEIAKILGVKIEYFYEGVEEKAGAGGSEGMASPPLMEFVSSGEGMQLSLAFMRIRDGRLRKRVLDLVKEIAEDIKDGEGQS